MKDDKMWLPNDLILNKLVKNDIISPENIMYGIKNGTISVLCSHKSSLNPDFHPLIVGNGTRKKSCVAIGMDSKSIEHFKQDELKIIMNALPDAVCDVSIGKNIPQALASIRNEINIPLGSCPTYDVLNETIKTTVSRDYVLETIEAHLQSGIDFILLHLGFNLSMLDKAINSGRVMSTTSRGGGALMRYMRYTNSENPFLLYLDDIIELCKKYQVVLDLGDVFRPGCLEDGRELFDDNCLKKIEIDFLSIIQKKAYQNGLQIVCEGGGHIPLTMIKNYVIWMKTKLNQAPLFFNGPLPTDRAVGLDSTANVIGVSHAALYGGDMFMPLTDAEHYAKPTPQQSAMAIRQLTVAISSVEYVLGNQDEILMNHKMGRARQDRKWQEQANCSLYPHMSANLFSSQGLLNDSQPCSLCGSMCPLLVNN